MNVFSKRPFVLNVANPVKRLTSNSAQINVDLTIEMVCTRPCMDNTSCKWRQKKEDELNFVKMWAFSDNPLQFSEKLTRFMGFLFCGTHRLYSCTISDLVISSFSHLFISFSQACQECSYILILSRLLFPS